ncbi:MAG TPA: TetR/AcrR family transcriptional regulator [Thermoanaerobaculia bacterium]|nr:TetR/AcrR family transcriptional regulator [Thermoanaerobaculia bacterium]
MAARQVRVRTPWESYKRQSIQDAVIRLICREGLASVTMERVAHETGIAKGTVYLHYRDKQELLDSVKESSLAPVIRKFDEALHEGDTPEQKLRNAAAKYFSYFAERRDLFRVLMYEREVVRVQGSRYRSERYRHMVNETARVIDEGIRSGAFRDVDANNVAAMFVESMYALMHQRLRSEKLSPVEQDADLITDLFVGGLEKKKR